jgi:LysM repeat protein
VSLTDLAAQLTKEAQSGVVGLQSALLSMAGTPPVGLDAALARAFQLAAAPLKVSTTVAQIGTPTATRLTMTGSLETLRVKVQTVTVTFTLEGQDANMTIELPLVVAPREGEPHEVAQREGGPPSGEWSFATSFPGLGGFPFNELLLKQPSFVFAGEAVTRYPWRGETLALKAGLNFAGLLTLSGAFGPLLALLSTTPGGALLLSGTVDPGTLDGKTLAMPDVALAAPLTKGPLPKIGFLQLQEADFGVEVVTLPVKSPPRQEPVQFSDALLLSKLKLGASGKELDCRVSSAGGPGTVTLQLVPDPKAAPPTLEDLFGLMGGGSWYADIPGPLQSLFSAFAFKRFGASVNVSTTPPGLDVVELTVGSHEAWTIFDGLEIEELDFNWSVLDPLGHPHSLAGFSGTFQFLPAVFKDGDFYASITTDLQIGAGYEGTVKLSDLLGALSGNTVGLPAHMDVELTAFQMYLDKPRATYSLTVAASAAMDLVGDASMLLGDVEATVTKAPNGLSVFVNGSLAIGGVAFGMEADYDAGSWHFDGGLEPGSSIPLGAIADQLLNKLELPPLFLSSDLELTPFRVTVDVPADGGKSVTWSLLAGTTWKFTLAEKQMEIDAGVHIIYDGAAKAYSGTISGEYTLPAIGLDVVLAYDFAPGSKDLMVQWRGFATAKYLFAEDCIVFEVGAKSLGDLLAELVRVVEKDPTFTLPEPWSLLNDISLKGFSVTWRLKPKGNESPVSVSYDFEGNHVKLFFIEISGLTLSSEKGQVQVGLTAKFITEGGFKKMNFPAKDPPDPPGQDTTKFELELLALGQHVTVAGLAQQQNVEGAVGLLQNFKPPTDPNTVPVRQGAVSGEPEYALDSQWLVATHFKLLVDKASGLALLDLRAIFNDPILYGLRVGVGGPQAGPFANLKFEIMYRKVSDTVGVYEIELQLPDWIRHIELGEVSITLPVIGIDVYTNGNFRIDLGFPANMNFSRSFGLEAFPFTGEGGFYFGILSSQAEPRIPTSTLGVFDPVYVFGLGLRVGLGKSIEEGILTASMTLEVFGIVEGVIAPWHPYPQKTDALELERASGAGTALGDTALGGGSPSSTALGSTALEGGAIDDIYYYWFRGTVGIVGTVVGEVNFAIISATVSITAQVFVQLTVEAHRAALVFMEVGVSVRIGLKINLGIFSITLHFSFSLTISAHYAIGSDSLAPWDGQRLAPPRAAALAGAASAGLLGPPAQLPARSFQPLAVANPIPLTLYAAPHLTLADWTSGTSPQAAYVMMLYIEGPIGQAVGGSPTAFEALARETLLWALTNFGAQGAAGRSRAQALADSVTLAQAQAAFSHFAAAGAPPVSYDELRSFLSTHFQVTLKPPATVASATALPMIPDLVLGVPAWGGVPAKTVDFGAYALCGQDYLDDIQTLLGQLAVDLETELEKQHARAPRAQRAGAVLGQSLATFVFEDWFALVCRHMLQAAVDAFGRYAHLLQESESLHSIIQLFDPANALEPGALGEANAGLSLGGGVPLTLNGVHCTVRVGESLNGIAGSYKVEPEALAQANANLEGLLVAGQTIAVGAQSYTIAARDTFDSIVTNTKATLKQVVAAIGPETDLLVPLAVVAIPSFTHSAAGDGSDTLSSLAATYGVGVAQIATDNATLAGIFTYTQSKDTFVDVPELSVLTSAQLVEVLSDSQVYANLAGISARFLMNGLRLPVNANIQLPADSVCTGPTCGMQALDGQQLTLPPLASSDAGKYSLTLGRGAQGSWVNFAGGASSLALPIEAAEIGWIDAVLGAASPAFTPEVLSIAALAPTAGVARRFLLPTPTPLQVPAPLALPVGAAAAAPTAFALPDGLLQVLAQPTVRPAFALQLGTPNVSGTLDTKPVAGFGWATLIDVAVKRPVVAAGAGGSAGGAGTGGAGTGAAATAAGTYELIGADPTGIVLLERLLEAVGLGAHPVASLHLLYAPNSTAPASAGLQGDDPATVSAFVVQSNLSTETNPPQTDDDDSDEPSAIASATVQNDPETLLRLVWECSIVQSGGYSLYYEASQGSPGLPEHLFDASGRAQVQLLVLLSDGANSTDGLGAYVNAAVVGDSFDASQTTVFAQSQAREAQVPVQAGDTLDDVAQQLHLTPSELAGQIADVPLASSGATLRMAGAVYETVAGDTLGLLATRFATTPAAIQAANPKLQIPWQNIPPWTLLCLPEATFKLGSDPSLTTLAGIAGRFSLSVAALGLLNRDAAMLAAGTLTVSDQIVDATAVLPPGIAGFAVARKQIEGAETDPLVYLDSSFHLLGYQLIDNVGFGAGPAGMPVSPHNPLEPAEVARLASERPAPGATMAGAGGLLQYQQLLPVARYAKSGTLSGVSALGGDERGIDVTAGEENVPPGAADPYRGVGLAAQPSLEWRDLFGNRARTPLSDATLEPTGPQNEPPVWVGYSDKLIGLGQWPAATAQYSVAAASPAPQLTISIAFDPTRYAGANEPGPARQHAEADRQTYAQAYYQLNQADPDGTPHVTITLATTLDGGAAHVLAGADLAQVKGFVLAAWQYLNTLLEPSSGAAANGDSIAVAEDNPVAAGGDSIAAGGDSIAAGGDSIAAGDGSITASVSLPVAATNPANIYELAVQLALARNPLRVVDASRDEDGVVESVTAIPAQLGGNEDTASLRTFAVAFESAYAGSTTKLKIAVGDSREGAAGAAEARLVWVVRTSTDLTQPIACQVTGQALFYAPPPLSTTPISRTQVPIWPFDPKKGLDPKHPVQHDYTGVDLDTWARQALEAIDRLLSPAYAVPAFVVDALGGTSYLERLRKAKRSLAQSIAGMVTYVLTDPAPPKDARALTDAQSKWEQQLLIALGSAYTVDVAVQVPVSVRCDPDPGYTEPLVLYGHAAAAANGFAGAGSRGNTGTAAPYTLSNFGIPAQDGDSFLTLLLTASNPGNQAYFELDLTYQVDQIEHQIGPVPGIDGYTASTWLTFPIPLEAIPFANGVAPTVTVPVVLRAYPEAPMLLAQAAAQQLDASNARTLLETATQWTYEAIYSQTHISQDLLEATATFNIEDFSAHVPAASKDLFGALARLLAVYPALGSIFDQQLAGIVTATDPTTLPFIESANALEAFTTLVEEVAAAWPGAETEMLSRADATSGQSSLRFQVTESHYPAPAGPELLVTVTPESAPVSGVPLPAVVFAGYDPVPTGAGMRYQRHGESTFLSWQEAVAIPDRTVAIGPLQSTAIQNARLGVELVRNAKLVPDNPTLAPFVYTTPLVQFASKYTPLLSVGEEIDVAALATGTPLARPLAEHLQTLFATFFAAAPAGTQTIALQVGYRYALTGEAQASIDLPIALIPSTSFVAPNDWAPKGCPNDPPIPTDPFTCRLAGLIRDWVSANEPASKAQLTFNLSLFSSLNQTTLPLVQVSDLVLARADITDL